jgi:hypothetical protein
VSLAGGLQPAQAALGCPPKAICWPMAKARISSGHNAKPMTRAHKTKRWTSGSAAEWMALRRPGRSFKADNGTEYISFQFQLKASELGLGLRLCSCCPSQRNCCVLYERDSCEKDSTITAERLYKAVEKAGTRPAGHWQTPSRTAVPLQVRLPSVGHSVGWRHSVSWFPCNKLFDGTP